LKASAAGREAAAFRDFERPKSARADFGLALGAVLPAPEDRHGADCLGDEAEDADREKPQTEVPHAIQDRPKVAPS
jgi:hypothetical protein